MALEAGAWRMRQEQARLVSLAWHTAALSHARRLPPLSQLIARVLKPRSDEPIEKRREEFEELRTRMTRSTKDAKGMKGAK